MRPQTFIAHLRKRDDRRHVVFIAGKDDDVCAGLRFSSQGKNAPTKVRVWVSLDGRHFLLPYADLDLPPTPERTEHPATRVEVPLSMNLRMYAGHRVHVELTGDNPDGGWHCRADHYEG